MCALVPPVYESYERVRELLRTCLGVSVSSEVIGIDKNPVVTKKLKHNASERDRQKKINSLFSSLRSCLPASDQSYIPELQEEVKKLIQKKEELLVRVSGQRDIEHHVKQQPKVVVRYVSTVSVTRLGDNEVMVQISSSKIHSFWISNVLSGLEEDGFCSCGCFIAKVSW
ncbi:hypothetical protein Bca101_037742 [Brassica carinata]